MVYEAKSIIGIRLFLNLPKGTSAFGFTTMSLVELLNVIYVFLSSKRNAKCGDA